MVSFFTNSGACPSYLNLLEPSFPIETLTKLFFFFFLFPAYSEILLLLAFGKKPTECIPTLPLFCEVALFSNTEN